MNGRTLRACVGTVGAAILVVGCGRSTSLSGDGGIAIEPDMRVAPDPGASHFYVVNIFSIAPPEGVVGAPPYTSVGYDVDGDAVVACGGHIVGETAEFAGQSPDFGSGIDNALGGDVGGNGGLADDSLQRSVDDASTVFLVEVRGVDDFTNDSSVGLTVYSGALPAGTAGPTLGFDGHLAGGQTFDILAPIFVDASARIVGGRVEAGRADFRFSIRLAETPLALTVHDSQLRFDISETSISAGVIGGYLTTAEVLAVVGATPAVAMYFDAVRDVLTGSADIDTNDSPTSCEAGSIALRLDGVSAVRGIDLGP